MTCSGGIFDRKFWVLGLGLWMCVSICAGQLSSLDGRASYKSTPASSLQPPVVKPPVDLFRSLLAMSPGDRTEFLARHTPEAQKLILAKVREYESLTPDQRELRLRVTELRWYLLPLLSAPDTNRTPQLNSIPSSELRKLIADRLQEWDKLPGPVQKELLDNESTVRFYFEIAASTPEQRAETIKNIPPAGRETLELGIRQWQALTDERRQVIINHFCQYFDLTPAEKDKTLRTLSEPERLQIEKTLQTFGRLTPEQRRECLVSFEKFASLSPQERQQFLKNAERWKLMTPIERQSWKNLVYNLSRQPPLPPGLRFVPVPVPPLPGLSRPTGVSSTLVTNAN